MNRILLAGATGYLGGYIAKELLKRSYPVRAVARNPEKLTDNNIELTDIVQAEITHPDSIRNSCRDIDVIISTIGITRQKDGLTYMDVDCQANMNLLHEANPIHGEDLATVCVDAIEKSDREIEFRGQVGL
ncbi:MAG: NAD(P)H-binding protein [Desulfobulbaceae bacterium]|nr:NAD(P)H-binding protein [Desulfobulbaceae bacterium]